MAVNIKRATKKTNQEVKSVAVGSALLEAKETRNKAEENDKAEACYDAKADIGERVLVGQLAAQDAVAIATRGLLSVAIVQAATSLLALAFLVGRSISLVELFCLLSKELKPL